MFLFCVMKVILQILKMILIGRNLTLMMTAQVIYLAYFVLQCMEQYLKLFLIAT